MVGLHLRGRLSRLCASHRREASPGFALPIGPLAQTGILKKVYPNVEFVLVLIEIKCARTERSMIIDEAYDLFIT